MLQRHRNAIAKKLTTGTITAIDRSPKMIEVATRRNRVHIDAGRARLEAVALGYCSISWTV